MATRSFPDNDRIVSEAWLALRDHLVRINDPVDRPAQVNEAYLERVEAAHLSNLARASEVVDLLELAISSIWERDRAARRRGTPLDVGIPAHLFDPS